MRPKREPLPRVKEAWIWIGGTFVLGLLGAGVTAAAVALWENIDIRQLTPGLVEAPDTLPDPEPPLAHAVDPTNFVAVLFDSPRNAAYFPDPDYHPGEMGRWRDALREAGAQVRNAGSFEQLRSMGPDELLVLAEAPCLSPAELAAVRAHVQAGGSVVANWAVGVRDGECEWLGWQTLLELTEAEDAQEIPAREGLYFAVPAGVPLAAGFDPGTRVELRPDPSIALRSEGPRVYWSDWALNPAPDDNGFGNDVAATALRTPEGGRTAWFGMRLGQAATPNDSIALSRLVQNGIRWAAGKVTASVAAWPDGARAAMVFSLDVEDQPRNAIDVAAMFELEELPGTFFAVTGLTLGDATLATALTSAGEVGTQTVDHSPLAGLTAQDQALRLRRSWADVEAWTGTGALGLRPPEESFDELTLEGWRRAGGAYLVTRNESRTASPELHATDQGPIVLLPRLIRDDYNVIVQDGAIRAERIGEAFVRGAKKVHAIGGIAIVAGHTQIMDSGRRLAAYTTVADSARAQGGWWFAEGGEIADWWRTRSTLSIELAAPGAIPADADATPSGHSDIVVTAPADSPLTGAWVEVVLPEADDRFAPLVAGEAVSFATTEWGLRVPVGTLAAGETRRISLVVVDAEEDAVDGSVPAGR